MKHAIRFLSNERGSIAVPFALSITGLVTAGGIALDYSRMSNARSIVQSAVDSAILTSGKKLLTTELSVSKEEFVKALRANLPQDLMHFGDGVTLEITNERVYARAEGEIKLLFGNFLGNAGGLVAAEATVPLGANKLEIGLVLDSTGSMGALGKMEALKQAANDMIDTIKGAQTTGTMANFAVVPFTTQVRVSKTQAFASWIDFRTSEPLAKHNAAPLTWDGCIMDRDKPNNTKKTKPTPGNKSESHPAQNCQATTLQEILPLTADVSTVKARIASLTPGGNTNTTIGMAWGYNVITNGSPLGDAANTVAGRSQKVIVFLTDGLNTEDRFAQPTTMMDNDMLAFCDSAKTAEVKVITIRVIEGNDALLRACASTPGDFYTTNDSAGLKRVFKEITDKLLRLRLSS